VLDDMRTHVFMGWMFEMPFRELYETTIFTLFVANESGVFSFLLICLRDLLGRWDL